jgi:uncharacterized protein YcbX
MTAEIGKVEAVFRYPVKSMAGERLDSAQIGWHGVEGDRRFALRRTELRSDFPWLSATKLPELILFAPFRERDIDGGTPTHVRTPEGRELEIFGEELSTEIRQRHGAPVEMMNLREGIFDAAPISVIVTETVDEIARLAGTEADVRRFRPNILISTTKPHAFEEDGWLGGELTFGNYGEGPRVSVTMRDERCAMVNLDPDSARAAPEVLKSVVRINENYAGVYCTVVRTGRIAAGQTVHFTGKRE